MGTKNNLYKHKCELCKRAEMTLGTGTLSRI